MNRARRYQTRTTFALLLAFTGLHAPICAWTIFGNSSSMQTTTVNVAPGAHHHAPSHTWHPTLPADPTYGQLAKASLQSFVINGMPYFAKTTGAIGGIFMSSMAIAILTHKLGPKFQSTNTTKTNSDNNKPTERFTDVAGNHEAKKELKKLVSFIKNPEEFSKNGAKPPKGILLVGPPGNGKTLLARALAGEADCAFFGIGASELIGKYIGENTTRIREFFAQARPHKPCILFIDEIDAIGGQRPNLSRYPGNLVVAQDAVATVNALLTELDGFNTKGEPIIVLAATNNPESLDPALVRPGRFDRKIVIPNPSEKEREEILKVHAKKVKIDDSIDFAAIAQMTPNFSGADLANIINEASRIAGDEQRETVSLLDLQNAWQTIRFGGTERAVALTQEERNRIAYTQAGLALTSILAKGADPLYMTTITPRGQNFGMTLTLPERDKVTETREEMLAQITHLMGGYAAQQVTFNEIFHQAQTKIDPTLQKAAEIAESIATKVDIFEKSTSSADTILRDCYKQSCRLLAEHKTELDTLAAKLLEKKTLQAAEIYELLGIAPRTGKQLELDPETELAYAGRIKAPELETEDCLYAQDRLYAQDGRTEQELSLYRTE